MTISDERLAEMVGAGVPCALAQPGEIAAVVQELRHRRKLAAEPFAYTTQTSIDLMRERPAYKGSFALFLPFEGMEEIKGVEFVPLYASPQPEAVITEEMVERACSSLFPNWGDRASWTQARMKADCRAALTAALKDGN